MLLYLRAYPSSLIFQILLICGIRRAEIPKLPRNTLYFICRRRSPLLSICYAHCEWAHFRGTSLAINRQSALPHSHILEGFLALVLTDVFFALHGVCRRFFST